MSSAVAQRGSSQRPEDVSNCVSSLIHAFTNGLDIFKKLRERRKKKKSRKHKDHEQASNAELQLSNSLRRGPGEIREEYEKGLGKAGDKFARGDTIAHQNLTSTLIKLNTGLVSIITAFLNHDSHNPRSNLNLDYKSLTHLSDASRVEAIGELNKLCQRLSRSEIALYQMRSCPSCGSFKHNNCSTTGLKEKRRKDGNTRCTGNEKPKPRSNATIARLPLKSSSQTQLVIMRPRNTRKESSSSSSVKSQSPPISPPYTPPLTSPLPQYTPVDPYPPLPPPSTKANPRKRSKPTSDQRPQTWPHVKPENSAPLPAPFPSPPLKRSPPPREKYTPSPCVGPSDRRRADKLTPSVYTFASDSTKIGEIPMRKWNTPFDYQEAERLNAAALAAGWPVPPGGAESKEKKKKGLFGFLRRDN